MANRAHSHRCPELTQKVENSTKRSRGIMGLCWFGNTRVGRGKRITKSWSCETPKENQHVICTNKIKCLLNWSYNDPQQCIVSFCFNFALTLHTLPAPLPAPSGLQFLNALFIHHYVFFSTCGVCGLAEWKTQKHQGWLGSLRYYMVQRQGCLQWFLKVRHLKFISLLCSITVDKSRLFGNFQFPAISVGQHAWRCTIFISLNKSVLQMTV